MKNISRHRGILQIIERLPSSKYGKPRYLFHVGGVTARTAPDSAHAYSLPNYDGRDVTVEIGTHYGRATLHAIRPAELI